MTSHQPRQQNNHPMAASRFRGGILLENSAAHEPAKSFPHSMGFTLIEAVVVLAIGMLLTAMSIPVMKSALSRMKLNSAVSQISGAYTQTRFSAIRTSQIYTLAITAPANTYVVTNLGPPVVANRAVNLPSVVAINGGGAGVYTFTFCPNGIVYGAGGICVGNANLPPALILTYQTRQTNLNFSQVGNVTTTTIR